MDGPVKIVWRGMLHRMLTVSVGSINRQWRCSGLVLGRVVFRNSGNIPVNVTLGITGGRKTYLNRRRREQTVILMAMQSNEWRGRRKVREPNTSRERLLVDGSEHLFLHGRYQFLRRMWKRDAQKGRTRFARLL